MSERIKDMENYEELFEKCRSLFSDGAFLVAGNNPMTIGWCQFGVVWGIPVCTVFVRKSRFTHHLMEENDAFTVSFPKPGTMKKELAFCGTKSGRDVNKTEELGLEFLDPSSDGLQGGIRGCGFHFECRKVFKAEGGLCDMDPVLRERFYGPNQISADGDPHTVYFGKVVRAFAEE